GESVRKQPGIHMQCVKFSFAVRVRICHGRGKIRQRHVTLIDPLTQKVREQSAHPLEPWFHPARLSKRTEIAKLDQKLGIRRDGKLEAIIASLVGSKVIAHEGEGRKFAVKLLPSCSGRSITRPFKTN